MPVEDAKLEEVFHDKYKHYRMQVGCWFHETTGARLAKNELTSGRRIAHSVLGLSVTAPKG
ncbi:MAG: hypothetical protein JWQ87_516 [Candidatus Sulfotelmatobacter sp.]|nr:hypothetical protein [Candidatus Sulfotelmatobacter sp.]